MTRCLALALILLAVVAAAPAAAGKQKDSATKDQTKVDGKSSLTDSVRRVERQTGGSVLSAEPIEKDGRQVNQVKVLTNDGRVRVVQVDPQQKQAKKAPPAQTRPQTEVDEDGGDPNQF